MTDRVKGVWRCAWCRDEIEDHTCPYRTPLFVEDGWPVGTGLIVCSPGCRQRPPETPVYTHWNRGAH